MNFTTQKTGEGMITHQLQVSVALGLPTELKVVCRSASRDQTSYEIFDQHGVSMGGRCFTYATGRLNGPLVDDLNVLLEEFDARLQYADFAPISKQAIETCEARYGRSIKDGDVVISIH